MLIPATKTGEFQVERLHTLKTMPYIPDTKLKRFLYAIAAVMSSNSHLISSLLYGTIFWGSFGSPPFLIEDILQDRHEVGELDEAKVLQLYFTVQQPRSLITKLNEGHILDNVEPKLCRYNSITSLFVIYM